MLKLAINGFLYRSASDTPSVDWWQTQCHFSRLHKPRAQQITSMQCMQSA